MTGMLAWKEKGKNISNLLLACLLLANAGYLIDTITYWNLNINAYAAQMSPNLFFWLGFCSFLKGPLLLWYTRSYIFRNFSFSRIDLIHLVPAICYPIYMYFIYYQQDDTYKLAVIGSYDVLIADTGFRLLRWAQDFGVIFYGFYCLYLLSEHKKQLAGIYASFNHREYKWLQILVWGFLTIWVWIFLSYLQVWVTDWTIPIGTISNYLNFALVNVLLIYGLSNSSVFNELPPQYLVDNTKVKDETNYPYVNLLRTKMEEEKLFARKDLTMERLAEELGVPVKGLSRTINGHFQKNFFEFLSFYRVEEAKRLLQEEPDMSIQQVMDRSGFRSKSAFNRFFRKYAMDTPSEYRRKHVHSG